MQSNCVDVIHRMMKEWQEWSEVPIDCFTLSIYHLQLYYSNEIKRGIAGAGNYSLAEEYEPLKIGHFVTEILANPSPHEIVKQFKCKMSESSKTLKKDFKQETSEEDLIPTSHMSMYARALLVVKNGNISFDTKMSTFIVKGSKEVKRIVTLFPKQTCSCLSAGECYHVLAAKLCLGIEVGKEPVKRNLTVLRKYKRPKKEKRCGRKRPRPNDVEGRCIYGTTYIHR